MRNALLHVGAETVPLAFVATHRVRPPRHAKGEHPRVRVAGATLDEEAGTAAEVGAAEAAP